MRTWPFTMIAGAGLLALASCSELTPDSHEQAERRWGAVRANLKCQIAAERLDKGLIDEAHKTVREALSLDPEATRGYVLLTRILLEKGETAAASQALAEARRCGAQTGETHYLAGLIAQRYGRFADALSSYENAAEAEPTNAHYVVSVAETLVALDRADEALALVRERWNDFDNNATLRALAGQIHLIRGEYGKAADAYRQAARLAPDDQVLAGQLGLALTCAGRYREGQAVLTGLLDTKPGPDAIVLVALGRCHLELGQYEEAKRIGRRTAASHPEHALSWSVLSQASVATGDLFTARRAATRARQIEPDVIDHAVLLGYVCWRQKDYPAAIATLEPVAGNSLDDMMTLYMLTRCHEATGNGAEAERWRRRALRIDPDCPWAQGAPGRGSVWLDPATSTSPITGAQARSP